MGDSTMGTLLSVILVISLFAIAILFFMLVSGGIKEASTAMKWTVRSVS